MKNYLVVTMPDQSRWRIPARFIAEHRARYYMRNDHGADWVDEVTLALADDYELKDWASHNMNWADVVAIAERLPDELVDCDYGQAWGNADKEVVAMPFVAQVVS